MNYIHPNDRMYALERAVHLAEQQGVGAHSTSDGARCYIAHFFAREMRRHDFATYIAIELAADFACALAQHLSTRQPGAQDPVASIDPRHLFLMAGKDGTLSGNVLRFGASMQPGDAPLYAAPPAQAIDLGQS